MTKSLIFDLGGVILDIDFALTHQAFELEGVEGFERLYSQQAASPFFVDFEKGEKTAQQFFDHIRNICGCPLSDETIRRCWNALIIGFDPAKIDWLGKLTAKYQVFLFSNTNIIHYQEFAKQFYTLKGRDFNDLFVKAYYSHEMGLRKPDPQSYQSILTEQGLQAAETLFIDDTLKNIEAAKELGLQTIHLPKPQTVLDLTL
ncbi:HAD family hydrolase [Sediminibacterium soli]|uniref:HAD family hydrolase n=1 Tax=Sediminibacterium soli TaxID=2698829 RepID=UPI00137B5B3C|nr:HAD family phosphatase [Sediminibacterium soli]NCI45062.1 HAD family phosphatase [Sediminibacterium soli]